MDQGVIENLNVHYRLRVIERLLIGIRSAENLEDRKVPILKGIFFCKRGLEGRDVANDASLLPQSRFLQV
ncbi:hypothetical protein HPB48_019410 [Haemaphysalis longicornis]|uniref:Uncharacterized protein n=1 Tax=Haemaphysalis longicornis TaxID=44386 RepID=A0A9J6GJ63_HAELO|nr:hypothetical protein HPB48_019410 [Haemaphysalis longicornis]